MTTELQSDLDATSETHKKPASMTVYVKKNSNGTYHIYAEPDSIRFRAKNGPRILNCQLELGKGVPSTACFGTPTYVPAQYMTRVGGVGTQTLDLTFQFQDKKVDGHLTFAVDGLESSPQIYDPQVGNDPPPHIS